MISVCIIAKNEEAVLGDCLESVKDADEIVVCDTGSTDTTVQIAESYGAKVCHFEWCDDFAKARNYAKQHCTAEWILSIDADETLQEGGMDKIRALPLDGHDAVNIILRGAFTNNTHIMPRLFRNNPIALWVGEVHEVINMKPSMDSDIEIRYGYSPSHALDPERTIRILSKQEPKDGRTCYYLAREYWYKKEFDVAIRWFKKCLEQSTFPGERADAWLYMARCYWKLSLGDRARECCANALIVNAHFQEAAYFMAELSWEWNRDPWIAMAQAGTNQNVLFQRSTKLEEMKG